MNTFVLLLGLTVLYPPTHMQTVYTVKGQPQTELVEDEIVAKNDNRGKKEATSSVVTKSKYARWKVEGCLCVAVVMFTYA